MNAMELIFLWLKLCLNYLQKMSGTEVLTSVDGVTLTELFFDTEKLVILGKTFGTTRSTSLDLTSTETDNEISNGGILSFTGTVRDHDTPAGSLRVKSGLNRFGNGTNLVNLQQESVTGLLLNGSDNTLGVSNQKIITNKLEFRLGVQVSPSSPIILIESIFNRDNYREKATCK